MRLVLSEAIDEDVSFSFVAASSSTADADDYTLPSSVTIPAGALLAETGVDIRDDRDSEADEVLDLELVVARESFLLVARGNPHRARIVIAASDNSVVGFATASTPVSEGIEVYIPLALGEPAPSDGIILAMSLDSDHEEDVLLDAEMRIAPGAQDGQYVHVMVRTDGLPEDVETARIALSEPPGGLPEGWRIGRREHELMIMPSNQTAMFAEAGRTIGESAGEVIFDVVLSADAPVDGVPLEIAIASGNEDGDVTFETQRFKIAQGERRHELSVAINDDDLVESSEVVAFRLSKQAGSNFPDAWGDLGAQTSFELNIRDNDSANIGFARSETTLLEGDTEATLAVSLVGALSQALEISLLESGDVENDIFFSPNKLIFEPGDSNRSRNVTLSVNTNNDDDLPEADRRITYTLDSSTLPDGVMLDRNSHVVRFIDDDKTIGFGNTDSSAVEGVSGHQVAVVLNFVPPAEGLEVAVSSQGEHAGDVAVSSTLRFTDSGVEKHVLVTTLEDNEQEDAETVRLTLKANTPLPDGWSLISDNHNLIINPNDHTAAFATERHATREGDGSVRFKVLLSADAPSGGVPLEVAVVSGNEDGDIAFTTQRFTIEEGNREHELTVVVNDDSLVESAETIAFNLSKQAGVDFPDAWGDLGAQTRFELTIMDNDSTSVGFVANETTLLESDTTATLTVSLAGPVSREVRVLLEEDGDDNNDIAFSPNELIFPPGEPNQSRDVTLTVNSANDDSQAEADANITYTLAGTLPDGVSFDGRTHVVRFVDDDKTIRFAAPNSSTDEGVIGHEAVVVLNFDPPEGGFEIAASASGTHAGDISIPISVLRFDAGGACMQSLLVNTLEDNEQESAEVVPIELAATGGALPEGWSIVAPEGGSDNKHRLTILPSDQAAMFAEAGRTVIESAGSVTFDVVLSADAPTGGVPLEAMIASGNEDGDVSFTTQRFTIEESNREHELTVMVNEDNLVESAEVIAFRLSKQAGVDFPDAWGGLGAQTGFELTITDNDMTNVGFVTDKTTLLEGDASATLTVQLVGSVSREVRVLLEENGDDRNDVVFSPSELIFAPGEADQSKDVTLTVNAANNDELPELDVPITYTLASTLPNGVSFGIDEHLVSLIDDDKTIHFAASASSADEGVAGHEVAVALNFDAPAEGLDVVVSANGLHASDVAIPDSNLRFSDGVREKKVFVNVLEDTEQEDAEIILLELAAISGALPDGWSIVAPEGSVDDKHSLTILPSDQTAMFAAASDTVNEGDGSVSFDVVLSADPPAGGVPLEVAIVSGNEHEDVFFTTQSFVMEGSSRKQTVTAAINGDDLVEPSEVVTFSLSKDPDASFPDAWGDLGAQTTYELSIADDDSASVGFAVTESMLLEGDTSATLTVRLVGSISQALEVSLLENGDVNDDLAFAPSVLTFESGETSKDVTLTVSAANDDKEAEADVAITYTLESALPDGVSFDERSHIVSLIDDDKTIHFEDPASSVVEGAVGHEVAVVLNIAPPSEGIEITVSAGGAHADDIAIPTPSLRFTGDTRSQSVLVNALEDEEPEEAEVVSLRLAATGGTLPSGWSIVAPHGNETADDDHDLTIEANDGSVGFARDSSDVAEDAGEALIALEVLGVPPVGGLPMRVEIVGSDANATVDDYDFDSLSFTLMPASDGAAYELVIPIVDDQNPEDDEIFTFTLHKEGAFPSGWGDLGEQTTHILKILANDKRIGFADTLPDEIEEEEEYGERNTHPLDIVWNVPIPAPGYFDMTMTLTSGPGDVDLKGPFLAEQTGIASFDVRLAEDRNSHVSGNGILISVLPDTIVEDDEEVVISLAAKESLPPGWTVDPAEYRFTIPSNDRGIRFSSADLRLVEKVGDSRGKIAGNLVLSLSAPAPAEGLNLVLTTDDEAEGKDDVRSDQSEVNVDLNVATGAGGVVFIPGGATEFTLPVTAVDDGLPEGDETIELRISKGENWPEGWGFHDDSSYIDSLTREVTVLANGKLVGWGAASKKYVSETNILEGDRVRTNYPVSEGELNLLAEFVPGTATADDFATFVPKLKFGAGSYVTTSVSQVKPGPDGIAEPDERAEFRLSVADSGKLPSGWNWSNQNFEAIILANENYFTTFVDEQKSVDSNGNGAGTYNEGTTVRLTASLSNPFPELEDKNRGRTLMKVTDHSDDISIVPVAPLIYESAFHRPNGDRIAGVEHGGFPHLPSNYGNGSERADYVYTFTRGELTSISFDVAINEDGEVEPDETIVISLFSGSSWGDVESWRTYTLTIRGDEGGTGGVGFHADPYYLTELGTQSETLRGFLIELSSPAPAGGFWLNLASSDPSQLSVPRSIFVPEYKESVRLTKFGAVNDSAREPETSYHITMTPGSNFPNNYGIVRDRSRGEVIIMSSDNHLGFVSDSVEGGEGDGMVRVGINVPNKLPLARGGYQHNGLYVNVSLSNPSGDGGVLTREDIGGFRDQEVFIQRQDTSGPTTAYIDIPITDDDILEGAESILLRLSRGRDWPNFWGGINEDKDESVLTIRSSDQTIGFRDESTEVVEGESAGVFVDFSIPASQNVTLMFHAEDADGNVVPNSINADGSDLIFQHSRYVPANMSSHRFAFAAREDGLAETDETFTLVMSSANLPDTHKLTSSTTRIIILSNDNLVGFTDAMAEVSENVGTVDVTLALTNPAPATGLPLRVPALANAVSGEDFAFTEYGNEFRIMPDDGLSYTFTIAITDDALVELQENFKLKLEKGSGFPDNWGGIDADKEEFTLSILIDETATIGFATDRIDVVEGASESVRLNFSQAISVPLELMYEIKDSSGNVSLDEIDLPGLDSDKLEIQPVAGSNFHDINIDALRDERPEEEEVFTLTLSPGPLMRALGQNFPVSLDSAFSAIEIAIPANDNKVEFSGSASAQVEEGIGTFNIELSLTNPAPVGGLPLTIRNVDPFPGTSEEDYSVERRSFTIPEDARTYNIPVEIVDDAFKENDEEGLYIILGENRDPNLPGSDNWGSWGLLDYDSNGLAFATFELIIIPSDNVINFANSGPTVLQEGVHDDSNSRRLEILIDKPVPQEFVLDIEVTDAEGELLQEIWFDSQGAASRTTLAVPANAGRVNFPVWLGHDHVTEAERSATITISGTTDAERLRGWEFLDASHEIILEASDNEVYLHFPEISGNAPTPIAQVEEGSGTLNIELRLTNPAPDGGLPLQFRYLGEGSAQFGGDEADYTFDSSPFVIPAGASTYSIPLTIIDDDRDEGEEWLGIYLYEDRNHPTGGDNWGKWGLLRYTSSFGLPSLYFEFVINPSD